MRNIFQKLLICGSILLSISFSVQTGNACSCDGNQTVDKEFAKTPNVAVFKLQAIKQIAVDANYFLRNLTLVPPEIIETITLSGTLVYSDGKPAPDETVQFLKGAEITDSSLFISSNFKVKTDKNGRFTIKTVKGQAGVLRGTTYSFIGEFLNCPALDEILEQKGDKVSRIDTNDVEIDATVNLLEIELKFPFPSCKKAKL